MTGIAGVGQQQEEPTMQTDVALTRSTKMNLIHEDVARAHIEARIEQARLLNRGRSLERVQRLRRRADRATAHARLILARTL